MDSNKWVADDTLVYDKNRVMIQVGMVKIDENFTRKALNVLLPETITDGEIKDLVLKIINICEIELKINDVTRH